MAAGLAAGLAAGMAAGLATGMAWLIGASGLRQHHTTTTTPYTTHTTSVMCRLPLFTTYFTTASTV